MRTLFRKFPNKKGYIILAVEDKIFKHYLENEPDHYRHKSQAIKAEFAADEVEEPTALEDLSREELITAGHGAGVKLDMRMSQTTMVEKIKDNM